MDKYWLRRQGSGFVTSLATPFRTHTHILLIYIDIHIYIYTPDNCVCVHLLIIKHGNGKNNPPFIEGVPSKNFEKKM